MAEQKSQISNYLSLFLRDELTNWMPSETTPATLKEKVTLNITNILGKIQLSAAPQSSDKKATMPMNKKITELIQVASDPIRLSQMDPTWSPWI
eukprot:TRINITY_DN6183_c0_g1_i1.p1 TRINITY_DN6183_c0_g1~~TRINITY_DN6183_c0_g1_i1.p1  ORF type:complete len:107 (-),score=25.77 TRINITY_DN6183_c0_g1_i1:105-386(-)